MIESVRRSLGAALVLLLGGPVGCDRPAPLRAEAPQPEARVEPAPARCLADELGPLAPGWKLRPECKDADSVDCRASCTKGDANACFDRAVAIEQSPRTQREAYDLFERACKLGLAAGCTNWGATAWLVERSTPWRCVYRVFEKTCAVKDPFGCGMMGRLLVEEGKTADDLVRARGLLESSCDELGGPPCRMLALYLEQGTYGTPDPTRIQALMKRACDGGDQTACGDHKTATETFVPAREPSKTP